MELLLLAILVAACRTVRLIPEQEIRPSWIDHVFAHHACARVRLIVGFMNHWHIVVLPGSGEVVSHAFSRLGATIRRAGDVRKPSLGAVAVARNLTVFSCGVIITDTCN